MNGNCLIVYESIYNNNTERLAKAMARELGCCCVTATDAADMDLSPFKAIGFGSGIYFGCHHPAIFELARKTDGKGKSAIIFSSRGAPFLGGYHDELRTALEERGFRVVDSLSVKGYDCTGPFTIAGGGNKGKPDEGDLRKAAKFVTKAFPEHSRPDPYLLVTRCRRNPKGESNAYPVAGVNGLSLLRGDIVTVDQDACSGCGRCVVACPLDVLGFENGKAFPKAELDCTLCELCRVACPERAITLHATWVDAIRVAVRHRKKYSLKAARV